MGDSTADVSAAAPDVREALARAFAEHHARKVVYAIDYEHADVALTAALGLTVADEGKARTPDESCISGAAEHAGAVVDDEGGGDE